MKIQAMAVEKQGRPIEKSDLHNHDGLLLVQAQHHHEPGEEKRAHREPERDVQAARNVGLLGGRAGGGERGLHGVRGLARLVRGGLIGLPLLDLGDRGAVDGGLLGLRGARAAGDWREEGKKATPC